MKKSFENVNQYLLPASYRKYGLYLIFGGIPFVLAVFTIIVFQTREGVAKVYWDEFGGYLIHIPLSLGLFWMLFSREEEEDEMYLQMRLKSTFHGIRFIFFAILMLPGFILIKSWFTAEEIRMPDIGGNLAVVTLMLTYAYGSYWWMKKQLLKNEE